MSTNLELDEMIDIIIDSDGFLGVTDIDADMFRIVEYCGSSEISLGTFPSKFKEFAEHLIKKICQY